ncbi:hypothetical protein H0N95_03080 [Candidatus Micrarchaeota archaeon]|nr:hypothetical protein [Candidatus Micrarchaeota archaeon]
MTESMHLINLKISGINSQEISLAVSVKEGTQSLLLNSVYSEVSAMQDEHQDLKFILRNEGKERIRNIVIEGNIPFTLSPEYPEPIDLNANEVKEIKIRITVPQDYPADAYDLVVKAGAGNFVVEAPIILNVESAGPFQDRIDTEVLTPWVAIKNDDGKAIGYNVTFRVKNLGITDLNGITWSFAGMPEGWDVSGNEQFSIEGYGQKDISLVVVPKSFDSSKVNVSFMKGDELLSKERLEFAGFKIGQAPTGMFLFGGSTAVGVIIVLALVGALLYVRSKNAKGDDDEEVQTRDYLQKLVDKAKKEQSTGKRKSRSEDEE